MGKGKVVVVATSEVRGVYKTPVNEIVLLEDYGVEGDAHAGPGDRQVSLLPVEALDLVPPEKREEASSGHTENILVEGIPIKDMGIGVRLKVGEAVLEIRKIGKDRHEDSGRAYVVSRYGRFCKVIKGGRVKPGDTVEVLP